MTIQAWSFLVSRNQSIDYKTVVAPDFISQAKIRGLLAKVTEEDFSESGRISIREVKESEVGNLTIYFRPVKARNKDIGEPGNEVLKDPFGREIYWVEGLVFQENLPEIQYKIGEIHFEQAHRDLQEKYRDFWHDDKLSISYVIDLEEVTSESDNKFRILEPLMITPRPQSLEKQERKSYYSSKSKRSKASLFKLVLIAIISLFLIGFFEIWLRSQPTDICLYTIQEVPIEFNPLSSDPSLPAVSDGIKRLKEVKQKHGTAWIWLNGSLDVETSFANQIKTQLEKQEENIKPKKSKSTITVTGTDGKNTLNIENHPIDSAIALLQNQRVTSGKLTARIIEPISPKVPSCNALQM